MKLIQNIMAKIAMKRAKATPEGRQQGETDMTREEIISMLADYKKQNPKKYEAKKEVLFARYNLKVEDEAPEPEPDENDKELEALKAKSKKK